MTKHFKDSDNKYLCFKLCNAREEKLTSDIKKVTCDKCKKLIKNNKVKTKMVDAKKLNVEEFSPARKAAQEEIEKRKLKSAEVNKVDEKKKVNIATKNKKGQTLETIKQKLGSSKMTRKELKEATRLTLGQIAGCIYKSKKDNGILNFKDGYFFINN